VDHIKENRAVLVGVTAVRWHTSEATFILVTLWLKARISAWRALRSDLAAARNSVGNTVSSYISFTNTERLIAERTVCIGHARRVVLTTESNFDVHTIRMGSSNVNACVQCARVSVIALLVGSTTTRVGTIHALAVHTRNICACVHFSRAIRHVNATILDRSVAAVTTVTACVFGALVVVVTITLGLAAVVDRNECALVALGITHVHSATIVVITVTRGVTTVLHVFNLALMIDARIDSAKVAVFTVVTTETTVLHFSIRTHVCGGVTHRRDTWIGVVAVVVGGTTTLVQCIVTLIEAAHVGGAIVVVVTFGVIGIAAARDHDKLALVGSEVARGSHAHVFTEAISGKLTAVLDWQVFAVPILVAVIVSAELVVSAIDILVAAQINRSEDTLIGANVTDTIGALIVIVAILVVGAARWNFNKDTLVVHTQVVGAHIVIFAFP
jgi:hypothetical protein